MQHAAYQSHVDIAVELKSTNEVQELNHDTKGDSETKSSRCSGVNPFVKTYLGKQAGCVRVQRIILGNRFGLGSRL